MKPSLWKLAVALDQGEEAATRTERPVTDADLERFCTEQTARATERGAVFEVRHEFTKGPKYARIISFEPKGSSRYVACFIELATGNILKADGWKKPARGIRGNIHDADGGASGMTAYGARYANA